MARPNTIIFDALLVSAGAYGPPAPLKYRRSISSCSNTCRQDELKGIDIPEAESRFC